MISSRGKIGVDVAPVPVIGSSKCPAYFLCYSRNQNLCGVHATEVLPPDILSGGCCLFYRALRTTRFPPHSRNIHPYLPPAYPLFIYHPHTIPTKILLFLTEVDILIYKGFNHANNYKVSSKVISK